jgi:hypothetical protein
MSIGSPTPGTIRRWHAALRLFRFVPAVGGHASDGDVLQASLPFSGEAELVAVFERLGRPLVILPASAPVPVPGKQYTIEEYEALRHPLRGFPRYESPSRTTLFGVSTYVSVGDADVSLLLAGADGDPYGVTEGDFENARTIERGLGLG